MSCGPTSRATCVITCTYASVEAFPVLDLFKAVKLLCILVFESEKYFQMRYLHNPKRLTIHFTPFLVVRSVRCSNLSFTLHRKFWHIPDHCISKIFTDIADLWISIRFISNLEFMWFIKMSNILASSWPFHLINMTTSVCWTNMTFCRISIWFTSFGQSSYGSGIVNMTLRLWLYIYSVVYLKWVWNIPDVHFC